jgi:hypothetical protein
MESHRDSAPAFFSTQVTEARRFYLDLSPPPDQRLVVICGGCEHCTPDYAIHRATFPYYSLEFVARGTGTVQLGGQKFALKPGRFFSYGPGIPQNIATDSAEPLVKYFVDFSGSEADALLRTSRLPLGRVCQVFPLSEVQVLFDELIRSGLKVTRYSGDICVKLLECLALRMAESRAPMAGAETLAFTTYQQCRQHIQTHFRRLRTLQQIADECRVNAAYLCRLFHRYDYQSPYQ